jgi:hypothetical protein
MGCGSMLAIAIIVAMFSRGHSDDIRSGGGWVESFYEADRVGSIRGKGAGHKNRRKVAMS